MKKSNVVKLRTPTKVVMVKAHKRVIRTKRATKVAAPKPVLFVNRGALLAHTSVSSVPVQITAETEKAWQFTAINTSGEHGRFCWFPKVAIEIVSNDNRGLCIKLASWFKLQGYAYRWINYNAAFNNLLKIA